MAAGAVRSSRNAWILLERATVGGTCVNVGCIPSKAELRYLLATGASPSLPPMAGLEQAGHLTSMYISRERTRERVHRSRRWRPPSQLVPTLDRSPASLNEPRTYVRPTTRRCSTGTSDGEPIVAAPSRLAARQPVAYQRTLKIGRSRPRPRTSPPFSEGDLSRTNYGQLVAPKERCRCSRCRSGSSSPS